ncbi:hypothetical protein [Streptomyces sp. NPDC088178]|uniref:hypothetical protein n=1 Tax=Streptomyces sp. NPDC088178 TaxID=3365836 RepID=UPI00382B3927
MKFDFELARDGSVDPTDKALYAAIASFVDIETRESPDAGDVDLNGIPADVPTRKRLAQCIGRSMDTVDRATKRLEDRRLLKVHRQADPDNPKLNLPSEYELLDHELWDERAAARAARRAARRQASEGNVPDEGGGRTDAATPGRVDAATPGRTGAAVKDQREVEEEKGEGEEAVSPRSGGDGRRPSDRSKHEREESGCAASGKISPSSTQHEDTDRPARGQKSGSNKVKHTREQLTLVAAVRAHFPAEFLRGLPDVPTLSQAILDALAGDVPAADRTVEQLGARIQQRWDHHGWASKFYAGQIDSLVGAAVAMVRPLKAGDRYGCANPRCEAGVDVDTKEECQTCPERLEARKAQRAQDCGQERATGANSAPAGAGSFDAALPPQRAVQPGPELRTTGDLREQARAAQKALEDSECSGRDNMCGRTLAPGQTLCRQCAEDAVEQRDLENAGAPAPF